MNEALYPRREIVHAGDCGKQPLKDLVRWAEGGTFHRYGLRFLDEHEGDVAEGLRLMRLHPARVEFANRVASHGTLDWTLSYCRAGDPEARGFTRPHMTPEDAAYAALTMIEERDREIYEQNLVVGLA